MKKLTEEERKKLLLEEFDAYQKIKAEGYAGILPNGNLVDRRDHPNALPIPENPYLGIPKPKKV